MEPEMRVVSITDAAGRIDAPDWLARAESVHRQLRPQLPRNYAVRLTEIFAGGARMALVVADQAVLTVAVWRVLENTYEGRRLYVDDLVSDESRRSQGAGKLMLDWLQDQASALGCDVLALDSGVQRARAHRFYFREGL
ncbi:MAG: GNAT family N-acetyltransferase, partial [Propionivibrio sp.]